MHRPLAPLVSFALAWLAFAVVLAGSGVAHASSAPHTDSLSSSRVEVRGQTAELRLRCQVLSMLEVWPALDADADGAVTLAEVRMSTQPILDYVAQHYRIGVGRAAGSESADLEPESWLELTGLSVEWLDPEVVALQGRGFELGALEVRLEGTAGAEITDVVVESTLFYETSPDHTDLCTVVWPDGGLAHLAMDQAEPRAQSDPTGRGVLGAYFRLGWEHLLEGWDHLAFVTALFLGATGLRALIGLVTAFTLAHSLTLALAATGWIQLARHQPLIEAIVALSIAFVALSLFFEPEATRSRWPEALGFGLIHGLGFAGFLGQSLVLEEARTKALLGFNLGVEAGQLLVVFVLWWTVGLVLRPRDVPAEAPRFVVARPVRRLGGLALGILGLYWFVERIA